MEGSGNSSTHSVIMLSWKKVEEHNKKVGFREGISDGKDQNFQKYFDEGFKEGFLNGFRLGRHKGVLKAMDLRSGSRKSEEQLRNSKKGLCCLCEDVKLEAMPIKDIKTLQQQYLKTFFETSH
ncbi:hypothetical protein Trydic_g4446 [Trypoxylus dichotomus]